MHNASNPSCTCSSLNPKAPSTPKLPLAKTEEHRNSFQFCYHLLITSHIHILFILTPSAGLNDEKLRFLSHVRTISGIENVTNLFICNESSRIVASSGSITAIDDTILTSVRQNQHSQGVRFAQSFILCKGLEESSHLLKCM